MSRALNALGLWRQYLHRDDWEQLKALLWTFLGATLGHWSSRQSRESSELSLPKGQGQWWLPDSPGAGSELSFPAPAPWWAFLLTVLPSLGLTVMNHVVLIL